ncbi:hypothetical protein Hypma_002238 [Hypsizygus marmoreus]|uniref:Uncharacterized protein n=1 Tax=Hypsizygus marmoreus TaxID=39966 RepID=A0A369K7V7_HYPMA|nr:hypothetical protein Hypma_002238 [Hypsizygus marmoreus]
MAAAPITLVTLDDTDPQIHYTGLWESAGRFEEYNSTTHGTRTAGSQATLVFKGSSVSVYGTIGRENDNGSPAFAPVTSYSVDGSDVVTFTGTPVGGGIVFGQPFYHSGKLNESQEHTLVITNTLPGKNRFWFDYIQIETSVKPVVNTHPGATRANGVGTPDPLRLVLGVLLFVLFINTVLLLSIWFQLVSVRRLRSFRFFRTRQDPHEDEQSTYMLLSDATAVPERERYRAQPYLDVYRDPERQDPPQHHYHPQHQYPYNPDSVAPFGTGYGYMTRRGTDKGIAPEREDAHVSSSVLIPVDNGERSAGGSGTQDSPPAY